MPTVRVFTLDAARQTYRHIADEINGQRTPCTDDAHYVRRRLRNGGVGFVKANVATPPRPRPTQAQALEQLQPVIQWMARDQGRQAVAPKGTAQKLVEHEQAGVPQTPATLDLIIAKRRELGLMG
jgi:hypothetical protein